jgi:hypothetical protein
VPGTNHGKYTTKVNTVDDDEQDKEECLLHCFEFADDENEKFKEVKIATWHTVVFQLEIGA